MIVVEGPDGSGKTTLINAMMAHGTFNLQSRVVGADTVALTDLKAWVEEHNKLESWDSLTPRLYDRHRLISEFVYGPIMGRYPEPGFDDFGWVLTSLGRFYMNRPLIIYCLPPMEHVLFNARREDTDNSAVEDKIESIWVAYARIAANDCLYHGALLWDYTRGSLSEFLRHVEEEIDDRIRL